jgi:HNH endonuclease
MFLERLYDHMGENFSYDKLTGEFTRLLKSGNSKSGSKSGSINRNGYIEIYLDNHVFLAHRLAWLFMTKEMPGHMIDHINGNKLDNRWANLRAADPVVNQQNRRKAKVNNSTGLIGVRHRKRYERDEWTAQIYVDGKHIHIGSFRSAEAAHIAYVDVKRQLHGGCTL